jgi:hypothetical protein
VFIALLYVSIMHITCTYSKQQNLTSFIARISTYLTPAIMFGVFIAIAQRSGGSLSVSTAFTSLSLISLLSSPLSLMFTALPQAAMTLACFTRIQDFLVEEDRDDFPASHSITNGMHIPFSLLSVINISHVANVPRKELFLFHDFVVWSSFTTTITDSKLT